MSMKTYILIALVLTTLISCNKKDEIVTSAADGKIIRVFIPASDHSLLPNEITDVNKHYLKQGSLHVGLMDRGTAWLDTGTFDSLSDAAEFVRVIEKRQDTKIGCIEEAAYRQGFINHAQLNEIAKKYIKSGYGQYLLKLN